MLFLPFTQIDHLMKSIHVLSDVDDIWAKPIREAEVGGGKVVMGKNIDAVNLALTRQAKLLVELKKHVTHELRMQTVASKSALGWKLVHRWELDFSREENYIPSQDGS